MKIFLIGYMGSGKSTVGKKLSCKLNLDFIDFDNYIENQTGKTISEIFEKDGEEKFRSMEHEYLKEIFKKENAVTSLGGGTPCFNNTIELINRNGISIYIEMTVDALVQRLIKARKKRPLIEGMNEVDLKFFIEANLEKRLPFYKQAKYTVEAKNKNSDELADEIKKIVA
ncbi:MAG: AAA family ATPase [Bacteroidetes bacterium]|nr:AAA family ATPase [Bacteroidota bacterium]